MTVTIKARTRRHKGEPLRAQLLSIRLTDEQHAALERIGASQLIPVSMTAVARFAILQFLAAQEGKDFGSVVQRTVY